MHWQKPRLRFPRQWVVQIPEVNYDMAYAAVCRLLNADTHPNAFFPYQMYCCGCSGQQRGFIFTYPEILLL